MLAGEPRTQGHVQSRPQQTSPGRRLTLFLGCLEDEERACVSSFSYLLCPKTLRLSVTVLSSSTVRAPDLRYSPIGPSSSHKSTLGTAAPHPTEQRPRPRSVVLLVFLSVSHSLLPGSEEVVVLVMRLKPVQLDCREQAVQEPRALGLGDAALAAGKHLSSRHVLSRKLLAVSYFSPPERRGPALMVGGHGAGLHADSVGRNSLKGPRATSHLAKNPGLVSRGDSGEF